jgi:hypothetical protein
MTLDEASFYFSTDHASRITHQFGSVQKMMLTVVWNPRGFQLIDVLPNGSKFNAGHYISHILSPLPEILAPYQDGTGRYFVIRTDNARRHCVKPVTQF